MGREERRRTLVGLLAALALVGGGCSATEGKERALLATGAPGPSPALRSDRWTALRPAGLARTEVAAARLGRHIYVAGGFERGSGRTTAAVERYDIRANRWARVRSMPLALNHAAAVAHGGRLYVVGGYEQAGDSSREVASLLRYEPGRDRWRRLTPPPTARGALAAAAVGDRLYAVGGAASGRALATVEVYDFDRARWAAGPDLSVAREHLAVAAAGGAVYALAGRAAGQGNFAVAERLPARGRRWQRLPDMRKPRGGIAAVAGRVVVFGGEEEAGTIREVELFDPARERWRRLPDLGIPRHGLGGVAYRDRVYAIEGGPEPGLFYSNALEALAIR